MAERTFEINIEDHMGFVRVLMGRGEPIGELAQFLSSTLAQMPTPSADIYTWMPFCCRASAQCGLESP